MDILKKIVNRFKYFKRSIFPTYFIGNPFLSSLYYFLFSSSFRREHHAVLVGKVRHEKSLKSDRSTLYSLIRNIHRIEKGLLMRPRRKVFALDFIETTIDSFSKIWTFEKMNTDGQYKWFYDVLSEYFLVCDDHPIINAQKDKFKLKVGFTSNGSCDSTKKFIPYYRLLSDKPNISYEEFYQLTRFRRSVRWFLDKKVPHDLIDKAILSANQSPSACNRQPFEFRIIDEPELLDKARDLPMGVKGYHKGIPMLVVAIGNLDAYVNERDRHLIYIDASLANMTFMLALETLGLSSCPINWPDIESLEVKMERLLNLGKHQRPIMCIAVGYPDPEGMVAFSEKRKLEDIRNYN